MAIRIFFSQQQEVLHSISNRNLAESEITTQSTKFKITKDFETA